MRSLAAGALALLAGGCLQVNATRCDNGAICRDGEACTEQPVCEGASCQQLPLCGPKALVEPCLDDAKAYEPCDVAAAGDGVCVDRVCTTCTPDLAGCGSTTAWESMTPPSGAQGLASVWIDSRTHALAGGVAGTLLEYDGRTWQRAASFPPTQGDVIRIFGTGVADVYAVTTATEVFHFDGTSWRNIVGDLPAGTGTIKDVHGAAMTDIYATGLGATLVHFNGSTWSTLHGSPGPTFEAVTQTPTGAVAVGSNGSVMEWNGSSAVVSQPLPTPFANADLFDVFVAGTKVLVAGPTFAMAGTDMTLLELSGATWSKSPVASTISQTQLYCAADGYAGGGDGAIYRYDGAQWGETPDGPSAANIRAIARNDGYVIAVGDGPVIWRLRER
jgi:hypothetical protein